MERIIQITADGSHTISIPAMEVTYHSKHGSIQESNHVFIDAGLQYYVDKYRVPYIKIMEVGFGTGLNALLTAIKAREQELTVEYHTIEAYPLQPAELGNLNHGSLLKDEDLFQKIHQSEWEIPVQLHPYCTIHKHHTTIEQFNFSNFFDCIFYDAFAPTAQPELWTETIFVKLYSRLNTNGILVTYCSKSIVRRAMQAAGFRVTKIPGPPGKREMVRAFKDA